MIVGGHHRYSLRQEIPDGLQMTLTYSSHLTHWRREVQAQEEAALAPKKRGPKPDVVKAEARRVVVLQTENTRLRQKLERAEQIIEAQKKLCEVLGLPTVEEDPR